MSKKVFTLSPLEVDTLQCTEVELDKIRADAETKFNLALEEFNRVKKMLFDKNGKDVDNWPQSDKNVYYSQIAKIDAITAESRDYIKRLTAEVTQTPN